MKIKQDFVTNSSSTSYIVCIPNIHDFLEKVEKKIKLTEEIKHIFFMEYIHFPNDSQRDYDNFEKIHTVIDNLGYILAFDEMGPENEPRYINIAFRPEQVEKLKRILGE